ncbi:MAG: allantoinase PuuE [Robiginitomaculum sp.]|nr:MAG: allantoinase PuuE [Robiginitomaculum sp.]
MTQTPYPRDLIGYGPNPPKANWPGGACIAIQIVLNYEEGGENSVLHGDGGAETFLSEIVGAAPVPDARHMSMESLYEYGSRAGVWRMLDLFARLGVPVTVFAVAMALQRNPAVCDAMMKAGHEIASHGLRWINYQNVPVEVERAHMDEAMDILTRLTGERSLGWYTGRTSPHTRDLVADYGGFLYDADDYSDDLPFWSTQVEAPHLIVPYTLDVNDMRYCAPQGFNAGDQFYSYLKDTFDTLYREGEIHPKMMSIGTHCRIVGRPGRLAALERFIRYAQSHEDVWFARRVDIARHWREYHPFEGTKT